MKTSKIIFISLLGTIALLILVTAINIRMNGNKGGEPLSDSNFKVMKQPIRPFRVLCLNDNKNISITQGDSSYISVKYKKDFPVPDLKFTIKGDTLFLKDMNLTGITICASSSFERLNINNSDIILREFPGENSSGKLTLVMDQSTAYLNQYKSSTTVLNIDARNHSNIYASNYRVELLEITLKNSKSTFGSFTKKVSGSLYESSSFVVRQPLEIALKRDAGSKINVY